MSIGTFPPQDLYLGNRQLFRNSAFFLCPDNNTWLVQLVSYYMPMLTSNIIKGLSEPIIQNDHIYAVNINFYLVFIVVSFRFFKTFYPHAFPQVKEVEASETRCLEAILDSLHQFFCLLHRHFIFVFHMLNVKVMYYIASFHCLIKHVYLINCNVFLLVATDKIYHEK